MMDLKIHKCVFIPFTQTFMMHLKTITQISVRDHVYFALISANA